MKLLFSKVLASSLLLLSLHRTCSSTAFTSPYQSGNTIKQYKGPKGASRSDGSALFQSSEVHNTPDVKRTQKRWPSKKGSKKQFKKGQKGPYKKNYKNNYKSGNFSAEQGARNKAFQVNRQITQCETAYDILDMMASKQGALTSTAGGGALTSINFSTALHRMAKYIAYNGRERKNIVVDPRFAMFISSLAEAYAGVPNDLPLSQLNAELKNIAAKPDFNFSIRESTNIVWGLTKIGIVPPQTALPLSDHDSVVEEMLQTSLKLRREVIEARQKGETKATWIPTLSHLTAKLTDAVARYVTAFDTTTGKPQEMANMLWAYASLQRSSEHLFDHISGALCSELSEQSFEGKPQEVSNTLWAYATYGYTGKYRIKMMEIAADVMRENKALLGSFKPQEFSNTAWAFASILGERRQDDFNCETTSQEEQDLEDKYCVEIMRHVGDAIISRCDEFKSQEISNTVWAMGCLGFGIGSEQAQGRNVNDYVIIKSDDYDYDEQLVKDAIAAVAASAVPRLRVFKNQELNNLAYGCARIMAVEPTLLSGIARELSNPRRRLKGQDVGTTLWSFATMEFFDEEAFKRVASNVDIQAVERWNPQELSNLIWAIGTAQLEPKFRKAFDSSFVQMKDRPSFEQVSRDPLSISFAAVAKELMKRPQEFKTQEIKDSLWGFSKAGVRHPSLFRAMAEHLVGKAISVPAEGETHCGRGFHGFSSQAIANILWAYAKQAQLAEEYSTKSFSGRMAVYCATSTDYGDLLIKRLINAAFAADLDMYGDLSSISTTDLSNSIWAMATMGYYHGPFAKAVEQQVIERMDAYVHGNKSSRTKFRGQEVANIIWALATTNSLSHEAVAALDPYITDIVSHGTGGYDTKSISQYLNRQEMANLVWSVAVAGHYPPNLIRLLHTGLLGDGKQNAEEVEAIYEDGGFVDNHIMNLLYLQSAMETDGVDVGVSLPPNFLQKWGMATSSRMLDENGISLQLTVSKIQQSVSDAFTRVGFDHVDEHIVPMQGHDLLSIDIADPEQLIGIEVDGPSHFMYQLDHFSPTEPQRGYHKVTNGLLEYQFQFDDVRHKMNGPTALKDRMLQSMGWRMIHIPYGKWYDLDGDTEAEEKYCRKLLEDAKI